MLRHFLSLFFSLSILCGTPLLWSLAPQSDLSRAYTLQQRSDALQRIAHFCEHPYYNPETWPQIQHDIDITKGLLPQSLWGQILHYLIGSCQEIPKTDHQAAYCQFAASLWSEVDSETYASVIAWLGKYIQNNPLRYPFMQKHHEVIRNQLYAHLSSLVGKMFSYPHMSRVVFADGSIRDYEQSIKNYFPGLISLQELYNNVDPNAQDQEDASEENPHQAFAQQTLIKDFRSAITQNNDKKISNLLSSKNSYNDEALWLQLLEILEVEFPELQTNVRSNVFQALIGGWRYWLTQYPDTPYLPMIEWMESLWRRAVRDQKISPKKQQEYQAYLAQVIDLSQIAIHRDKLIALLAETMDPAAFVSRLNSYQQAGLLNALPLAYKAVPNQENPTPQKIESLKRLQTEEQLLLFHSLLLCQDMDRLQHSNMIWTLVEMQQMLGQLFEDPMMAAQLFKSLRLLLEFRDREAYSPLIQSWAKTAAIYMQSMKTDPNPTATKALSALLSIHELRLIYPNNVQLFGMRNYGAIESDLYAMVGAFMRQQQQLRHQNPIAFIQQALEWRPLMQQQLIVSEELLQQYLKRPGRWLLEDNLGSYKAKWPAFIEDHPLEYIIALATHLQAPEHQQKPEKIIKDLRRVIASLKKIKHLNKRASLQLWEQAVRTLPIVAQIPELQGITAELQTVMNSLSKASQSS